MGVLYHYANNLKGFNILAEKSIRLSDIRKSNDYEELVLFYPDLFDSILRIYRDKPFEFRFENEKGLEAINALLFISKKMLDRELSYGEFSNFVLCLSEEPDLLSQWRGYADDGQGISIGFSKRKLQKFCDKQKESLRLEKVTYITEEERGELVNKLANAVIEELKTLREWIVDNMTHDDASRDTDSLLAFNFDGIVRKIMTDSLMYKQIGFAEEKEWRLFLREQSYKTPRLVLGEEKNFYGPNGFLETISFLRNRIQFRVTNNNLSPYIPVDFSEFGENGVKEIWIGPKNDAKKGDIELFLASHGLDNIDIYFSETSYR